MKFISVILSFAILLTGCYTHTTVTKDSSNLDNKEFTFYLTDGTYIKSEGGQHIRLENGYKIVGKLRHIPKDNWNTLNYQHPDSLFDGIVFDPQIKEVVVDKLEIPRTILALLLPVVFIGLVFGLHITTSKVGGL